MSQILTEAEIINIAAQVASNSLKITRFHELGGPTRTTMEEAGVVELGRAIESAVLAKIATTPAASPIPIDARRRTLLNSLATLRESKHLSMDGHSYLIDAVQKAFATREKTEPSPDFIEAVSCFRKAAWERDHPEMMRWQLRIMELVREGEA